MYVADETRKAFDELKAGKIDPLAMGQLARHLYRVSESHGLDGEDACQSVEGVAHSYLLYIEDEATLEQERAEAAEDDARYAYADDVVRSGPGRW